VTLHISRDFTRHGLTTRYTGNSCYCGDTILSTDTTTGCARTVATTDTGTGQQQQQHNVVAVVPRIRLLAPRAPQALPCPGNAMEDCGSAAAMAIYGNSNGAAATPAATTTAAGAGSGGQPQASGAATTGAGGNATMGMGMGGGSICVRKTAFLSDGMTYSVMNGPAFTRSSV